MNLKKLTAFGLSIVMSMSMMMPSMEVLADEVKNAEETNVAETTEPKEKETKKPEETKPAETKATEPEEKKPADTNETKESEKEVPSETEKQLPKETEAQEPEETKQTEPKETEKTEPSETEDQNPKETEPDASKETEKTEPAETEQPIPSETDKQEPVETDKPQEPDGTDSKPAKNGSDELGTIANAKIADGKLTWTIFDGAVEYLIEVDNTISFTLDTNSFDINKKIDRYIRVGELTKHSVYHIDLYAYGAENETIATWSYDYSYSSSAKPYQLESISNVNITEGILSWDAVEDAIDYEIEIAGCSEFADSSPFNLNRAIDKMIKNEDITKSSSYSIKLIAYLENYNKVAEWNTTYNYNSSAVPIEDIGDITGVKIENGVLTWDSYPNADSYSMWIAGSWIGELPERSLNLYAKIDQLIKDHEITKADTYEIEITALDSDGATIARVFENCTYSSSANPDDEISNVQFKNGILTWGFVDGAKEYVVGMPEDNFSQILTVARFDLGSEIDDLIRKRFLTKASSYAITIEAFDDNGSLAKYSGTIQYESSAEPISIGTLSNVAISNGVLNWDSYEGADFYYIYINDYCLDVDKTSFAINATIDDLINRYELPYATRFNIKVSAYKRAESDNRRDFLLAEYALEYDYSPAQPQFGTIKNATITNGILKWDAYEGAVDYLVRIGKCEVGPDGDCSLNLNEKIYELIYDERLENSSTYKIEIIAYGEQNSYPIAIWTGSFDYSNPVGSLKNVKIANDVISWDPYLGANEYKIKIGTCELEYSEISDNYESPSVNLKDTIDKLIKSGELEQSESYSIEINAFDSSDVLIAKWSGAYTVSQTAVIDSGKCGENIEWTLYSNGTLDILGYGSIYWYSDIPSQRAPWRQYSSIISTVNVSDGITSICEYMFRDCININLINLPDSINSIGQYAFSGCVSLKSINLPSNITVINDYTFEKCKNLTGIIIPKNVDRIGVSAFEYCSSLKNIVIPDSVSYIGHFAFGSCTNLANYEISNCKLILSPAAFYGCTKLSSVTIPDNTSFSEVFDKCSNIKKVTILDGAKNIADYSFTVNTVSEIIIPDSIETIGCSAFYNCSNIKMVIPNSVKSVGSYSFYNCTNLTSIPESLLTIGDHAYDGCVGITDIKFNNEINQIGSGAFNGCTGISSVIIPNTITSIGRDAFKDCTAILFVSYPNVCTFKSVFSGCDNISEVVITKSSSNNLSSLGEYAFSDLKNLKKVTLPDCIDEIDIYAFYECNNLISIIIPKNVTVIHSYAFKGCEKLNELQLPSNLKTIGEQAFWECSALTNIVIPLGVTNICDGAFSKCTNLKSVTIPNSVISIGSAVFAECVNLISISIPDSVTSIGSAAFSGCISLTEVNLPEETTINLDHAFFSCKKLTSVTIPKNVTLIGNMAFSYCDSLTEIVVPDGVTIIDDFAFSECKNLKKIIIPDSLETIGNYAFYQCFNLKNFVFPKNLSSVGDYAFNGSLIDSVILLPDKPINIGDNALGHHSLAILNKNSNFYFTDLDSGRYRFYYDVALLNNGHGSVIGNYRSYGSDNYSFIVTPDNGYCIEKVVLINGNSTVELTSQDNHDSDYTYSYTMPDSEDGVEIKVLFKLIGHNRITVADSINGTVTVDKETAKSGDSITITATPEKGYEVDTVAVNGNIISGTTFVMPDENVTVNVTFKKAVYTVATSSNNGGTVKPDKNSACLGDLISLSVSPDIGFEIDSILINGEKQSDLSFIMPAENVTVSVTFRKSIYSISVKISDYGNVEVDKSSANYSDIVTIITTPAEGFTVDSIKINGKEIKDNTFMMPAENVVIVVEFKPLVGYKETNGNLDYQVTNNSTNGTGTVTLTGVKDASEKTIVVPSTVEINGSIYKVNRISGLAFKNNKIVNTIVIGANVTVIDPYAFQGCTNLIKVSGLSNVRTIGAKAFANCPKLKTLVITSPYLSKIGAYSFYGNKSLKTIYIKNTSKLTKSGVKKSLKGSRVKTVKVKKSKVKKYKKYFTKKNCGRKVKVKK